MTAPMEVFPKQLLSLQESTARVNVWHGSIRAGKTIASIMRFLIAIAVADHGGEIVISGRTRDSIFRNVISVMQDPAYFGVVSKRVLYTQGAPTATILGRKVHVIGASDVKAEMTIRGMTVLLWYADELTVHPEGFTTQMLGRMSPPKAQAFVTTNPDGPRHWLYIKYILRADELNWRVWHFTLDDNLGLTADYVEAVKAEFTGLWYKRFILGLWVAAEGAVYDGFDPELHTLEQLPCECGGFPAMHLNVPIGSKYGHKYVPVEITHSVCGVDYGTANAFAAVLLGIAKTGRAYVLDEWRHDSKKPGQTRWTDAQLSVGLQEFLARQPEEYQPDWVTVDPSAASFHTQLQYDSFARVMPADNQVLTGIRNVASLLSIGSLTVLTKCAGLLDEFPGYVWDPEQQKQGHDAPLKENDHSLDALRYAVLAALAYWGNQIHRGVTV